MTIQPDLCTKIGSITLKNPVITASGTFGYANEYKEFVNLNKIGGIVVKGLSLEPCAGNPSPRVIETPCGLMNAVGLENVGIDLFIKEKLPFFKTISTPVFANIYGKTIEDYAQLAKRLEPFDEIAGIEVNISCPNVKAGGVAFGVDPSIAYSVVKAVREHSSKTIMVKLSPNVTDITVIARSVEDAGADAISLINTLTGLSINIETKKPRLANITGGLSGPAIKPVALRMVWQTAQTVKIPVVGIGGIMNADDAIEFIIAGATAVQIGTANFLNPNCSVEIADGILKYLKRKKIKSVVDLIGTLKI